jgi:hypothetical protein
MSQIPNWTKLFHLITSGLSSLGGGVMNAWNSTSMSPYAWCNV